MTEIDLDRVLDLEAECYSQGFAEGSQAGKHRGFIEGRELGIQTGFQRYLSLGILQARHDNWNARDNLTERQLKQLEQLRNHTEITDFTNNPAAVELVDMALKRGKNKAKLLAAALQDTPVTTYENIITLTRGDDAIEDIRG